MTEFKLVTVENFHEYVPKYITDNKIIISDYDDVTDVVLRMIRAKYFFNFDKNILRGFMEDLAYMFSPDDDLNKDRVLSMLESSDDEDDIDIDIHHDECNIEEIVE
tara:strand:+ start:1181 stop:1498 length:318 start_codon:yes stop_codon:yes gene_type:complete